MGVVGLWVLLACGCCWPVPVPKVLLDWGTTNIAAVCLIKPIGITCHTCLCKQFPNTGLTKLSKIVNI